MENYDGYEQYGRAEPSAASSGRYTPASGGATAYPSNTAFSNGSPFAQTSGTASRSRTMPTTTSAHTYGQQAQYAQALQPQVPTANQPTSYPRGTSSKTRRTATEAVSSKRPGSAATIPASTRSPRYETQPTVKEESPDIWPSEISEKPSTTSHTLSGAERTVVSSGQRLDRVPSDLRDAMIMLSKPSETYPGLVFYKSFVLNFDVK